MATLTPILTTIWVAVAVLLAVFQIQRMPPVRKARLRQDLELLKLHQETGLDTDTIERLVRRSSESIYPPPASESRVVNHIAAIGFSILLLIIYVVVGIFFPLAFLILGINALMSAAMLVQAIQALSRRDPSGKQPNETAEP